MKFRPIVFLCLLSSLLPVAAAQTPQDPPPASSITTTDPVRPPGAKGSPALPPEKANPVRIKKFESAVVIDGQLNEDVWKTAVVLKDFYQTSPGDNIAPSKPTEVLMGYDSKNLYIAFRAFDDKDKIRATIAKRDEVFDDDNVHIFLDTFNDNRKAYILMFNPFGIQADGILTEGRGEDYSLDIVMESKGVITDEGYVVEVAVPFKSLRYEAGENKLWGIHVARRIKRFDNEKDSWMPVSRERSDFLSQGGRLTGLVGISTERTIEIIPTLTISEEGRRIPTFPVRVIDENPSLQDPGRFVNRPARLDPGVTMKLGVTSNLTLDFAVNPDFAQVEADQPVVTANQRFPIFFAEKRPFFLEGKEIFETPIRAVHTRAIIDPDYAAKLTGKQGRYSFGLLAASDNAPGDFSDEEKSDPDIFQDIERFVDKNAFVGILRVKRDIGKESSIGFLGTSYNFIEQHNQLAGVDGRFRLDPKTVAAFQVLGTTSRRHFYNPEKDENEYRTGNALAYYWEYDFTDRTFGYNLNGSGRSQDYRSDVGFNQRTDTNNVFFFWRVNTDPKPNATVVSTRFSNFSAVNWNWSSSMQDWVNGSNLEFTFQRQTFLNLGFNVYYERLFEEEFGPKRTSIRQGAFLGPDSERSIYGRSMSVSFSTTPSKKYSISVFAGRIFNSFDLDFGAGPRFPRVSPAALADPDAPLDPGPGNVSDLNIEFNYKPTDAFSNGFRYTKSRLVRSDTNRLAFDANIFTFRSTYQFTRFTFVRARLDYDTLSSRLSGQFLLGWAPNPGTSLYVGYNDDLNHNGFSPFTGHSEPGFRRNGRTFFIKTSYLFRRSI